MNPPNHMGNYYILSKEYKWIQMDRYIGSTHATLFLCIYGHTSDSETCLCTPCDSYLCVYMDIHQIQKHCLAHHVTFIFVDISTSDSETFLCVYMDKHFLRLSFLFRFIWIIVFYWCIYHAHSTSHSIFQIILKLSSRKLTGVGRGCRIVLLLPKLIVRNKCFYF